MVYLVYCFWGDIFWTSCWRCWLGGDRFWGVRNFHHTYFCILTSIWIQKDSKERHLLFNCSTSRDSALDHNQRSHYLCHHHGDYRSDRFCANSSKNLEKSVFREGYSLRIKCRPAQSRASRTIFIQHRNDAPFSGNDYHKHNHDIFHPPKEKIKKAPPNGEAFRTYK